MKRSSITVVSEKINNSLKNGYGSSDLYSIVDIYFNDDVCIEVEDELKIPIDNYVDQYYIINLKGYINCFNLKIYERTTK